MKTRIVLKKVKKSGHGDDHGGQWKVAYADFVTALMAFFLLMWLVSMIAPEKRARVAEYFKHFSIFQHTSASLMDQSTGVMDASGAAPKVPAEIGRGVSDVMSREFLKEKLRREIEAKLSDVKDQIMIDIFEGGVRIQLIDKEGNPMFRLGSAEPTPDAKKILSVVAETVRDLPNKIAIEGHTDALSYASNRYTNWELSTDRASASRKELEKNGLDPDRLNRVAGYAATYPLIKENPKDPRNRRISIILLSKVQS